MYNVTQRIMTIVLLDASRKVQFYSIHCDLNVLDIV